MSDGQMELDMAGARKARDRGMKRAADHADAESEGWQGKALERFRRFAAGRTTFTTEDVRAANQDFDKPPDDRAWGQVARAAVKAGLIEKAGYTQASDRRGHCRPVTMWRSKT